MSFLRNPGSGPPIPPTSNWENYVTQPLSNRLFEYGVGLFDVANTGRLDDKAVKHAVALWHSTSDGVVSHVDAARIDSVLASTTDNKLSADSAYERDGVARRIAIVKASGGTPNRDSIRAVPKSEVLALKRADRAAAVLAKTDLALVAGFRAAINEGLATQPLEVSALEAVKDLAEAAGVNDAIQVVKDQVDVRKDQATEVVQNVKDAISTARDQAGEKLSQLGDQASALRGAAESTLSTVAEQIKKKLGR